jgi:ribose/xylose/arabinose/galactoside ABC-type transport system permease subunit
MKKNSLLKKFVQGKSPLLIVLILIVLAITYIVEPGSFTKGNAQQIMSLLCYLGIISVGVACLLMCGGIDLATSAHATFGMLLFAQLLQWGPNLPWPVAALAAIAFGAIAGGVNAFLAQGLRLMPFIATIGMSSVWSGLAKWYTRGNTIPIRNESFSNISSACIGNTPIPWLFVFVIAVVILYSIVLKRTRFGRSILMVGGNPLAARLAGLHPDRVKSLLFVNNGVLAAVGGLIWASQQKMYSPTGLMAGMPEITALTASILGGVSFIGGSGSLGGAFLGVMLIQVLEYALQAMYLPLWFITAVKGSLLLIALTIDAVASRKRMKGMGMSGMAMPGMSK